MKNLIKGIIIGIAKIIPGLSGAVLMISFNLYDKAILAITNFFDDSKKNFFFLLEIGIGVVVGIVLFSKVIVFFLSYYYLYTTSFFVGLIFGGIPVVTRQFSKSRYHIILVILAFFLVSGLAISNINYVYRVQDNFFDLIVFFFSGILEALGTVIPGVSSTALLMLIGVYSHYITVISQLFSISMLQENLYFLIPFSLGLLLGIIIISLLINYLFQHYKEETFAVIFGFSLSSIFLLIIKLVPFFHGIGSIILSFILFIIGFLITNKL